MTAVVSRSSAVKVWIADRFDLRAEGNALGLDTDNIDGGSMSDRTFSYSSLMRVGFGEII